MRITKTVRISEAYAILVHVLRGQKTPQFIIQLNYGKEFRNKEIHVKEQRKVTMKEDKPAISIFELSVGNGSPVHKRMIVRKTICQSEEKVTSSFVLILIVLNFIKNKYHLIIKHNQNCV